MAKKTTVKKSRVSKKAPIVKKILTSEHKKELTVALAVKINEQNKAQIVSAALGVFRRLHGANEIIALFPQADEFLNQEWERLMDVPTGQGKHKA